MWLVVTNKTDYIHCRVRLANFIFQNVPSPFFIMKTKKFPAHCHDGRWRNLQFYLNKINIIHVHFRVRDNGNGFSLFGKKKSPILNNHICKGGGYFLFAGLGLKAGAHGGSSQMNFNFWGKLYWQSVIFTRNGSFYGHFGHDRITSLTIWFDSP